MAGRILLFTLLLFTIAVQAQERIHPIDAALDSCMNVAANQTTFGTIQCLMEAHDAWDAELNVVYKTLKNKLDDNEQQALVEAQRQWIRFRDAELEFSGRLHANMQGTMYRMMHANRVTEMTKQRMLDLQSYLDTLNLR